ncbi:uncharacterized protein LOC9646225 [Selaginella moellendorffii]|uniref:uncharacterized protein LOC9646225 n=1 Tax=Selaginella moellendorffii TaxID=88036 RepID=UPI000D1C278D|nr:uncharacterized protein LOC9646225 [Selaginella moellendorffii]|eukprot:XP_024536819.1 uncharacterized protein LOC9646225 [Selaginella moellendorffii]
MACCTAGGLRLLAHSSSPSSPGDSPARLSCKAVEQRHSTALAAKNRAPAAPNPLVLEAQGRVCTGQTQTRPLGEDQAFKVLQTIARSAREEIPDDERVSGAQLGAFFAAMAIRSASFPRDTQWSEGERKAMRQFWPQLVQVLPPDVLFVADPDGTLMEDVLHSGLSFVGRGPVEMRLVGALREMLRGDHLGFEEIVGILRDLLPLGEDGDGSKVSDVLVAAFLIALRMNGETDRELKAFCMAFDDELGELPVANVSSLTHYGEPYDGNTRFFRSTLFVAAVRASYGECCLLHGVDRMPPKWGVTEEQMLNKLGAATTLSPAEAASLLEDVGFAYVSQREARKSLYSLLAIREHIKKRPTVATTEKVQRYVKASGREAIVTGFYHQGYEEPLLMLMRRRGVDAGLIVKGEEGALSLTTKSPSPDATIRGHPLNFCAGFRPPSSTSNVTAQNIDGILRETFSKTLNATDFHFESTLTPRLERPRQLENNIEHGLTALRGVKGAAYDRIVFNAAMVDNLLGCSGVSDPFAAIERAREAIDSGKALKLLMRYVSSSSKCVSTSSRRIPEH